MDAWDKRSKQLDAEVRGYIYSLENQFWEKTQEILLKYKSDFLKRGLEIETGRYWYKRKSDVYMLPKHEERLSIEQGYYYVCNYRLKKDGKYLTDRVFGDEAGNYTIVYLRIKPNLCSLLGYRLGIVKKLKIKIEIAKDEETKTFLGGDLDYFLRCVDVGFYSTKYSESSI